MPRGPIGEKRPAEAIGRAVMIGTIASGKIEGDLELSGAAASRAQGPSAASSLTSSRPRSFDRR